MIITRFKMQFQPGKCDEVMPLLKDVIAATRPLDGVISFDIGRAIDDPDVLIATEVYEDDRAALDRQESLPEVARAMAAFPDGLAGGAA
jgi:quinol monooxygenase YgiN